MRKEVLMMGVGESADSRRYDGKAQVVELENIVARLRGYIEDGFLYTNRWANRKVLSEVSQKLRGSDEVAVCEWGCYLGKPSIYLAGTHGNSRVHAFDVSQLSIEKARSISRILGVDVAFDSMDGCNLEYSSESFDVVFGFGVLHHVHRPETYREIYRVLKKGGQALFVEPTQFNPLIRMYRKVRSEEYSPDERPFEPEMFDEIRSWIPDADVTWRGEQLLTTYVMLLELLLFKSNKKFIGNRRVERFLTRLQEPLGKVDDFLIEHLPGIERLSQLVTLRIDK